MSKSSRVSRREAAAILGTTPQNVRNLQRRGKLRGEIGPDGVCTFARSDVEALARKRARPELNSGALAARLFQMFKDGRRFEEIVIETRQDPEVVLRHWEQYQAGYDALRRRDLQEANEREERAQLDHDARMRELDEMFFRKSQAVFGGFEADMRRQRERDERSREIDRKVEEMRRWAKNSDK